jgi:hypothetical protein
LIGGFLIAATGAITAPYLLDVVAFGAVIYAMYRLPKLPPTQSADASRGWKSVKEGFEFLRGKINLQMSFYQDLVAMVFGMPRALFPAIAALWFGGTTQDIAFTLGMLAAAPALGGLIFVLGASAVYATALVLLLLACALLWGLGYQRHVVTNEAATVRTVLAGVHFVWHNKLLLGAISLDLFAVLLGGATALLPMFAKDILMVGPWGLGLLRAAPAVGALAASMWLTTHPLQRRVGHVLLVAVAVFGCAMALFALSTHFWLSMVALAISGAADTASVVIRMTLMQLETPDEMRGRVGAVNSIFIGASNELGEFESGAAAAWLGPVMATLVGGLGTILVAVMWLRLFPKLAQRDKLE